MATSVYNNPCFSDNSLNNYAAKDLPYLRVLPNGIDIFRNIIPVFPKLDEELAYNTRVFLNCYIETLVSLNDQITISNSLPRLSFTPFDDNTLLIEWIFRDFRIGFSIDKIAVDSNWYLVTNEKFKELTQSGSMDALHPEQSSLRPLISFALQNS
jgi:hypothetical protein